MKKAKVVSEDWVVVILGFLLIGFFLLGFKVLLPAFSWEKPADLYAVILNPDNLIRMLTLLGIVWVVGLLGARLTGRSARNFTAVFIVVYLITMVAMVLAGNSLVKSYNLETVIFSLILGLVISNVFRLPVWFRNSITSEMFVKIGLVLLGTSIIFGDILKAGAYGLIQALVVVVTVWYFSYWLCRKLKIDDEMSLMLSSAVSICGVSAAIATAGAINGDNKKLSYVVSLVLIVAIPMMIFMPYLAKYFGMSQEVAGAWMGGSIDTTGAVVASGTMVGEEAVKISSIVKFSQNVLLGLAAFAISVYWTYAGRSGGSGEVEKPTLKVIWQRFPKFIVGFVAASLLFSFIINKEMVTEVKDSLKTVQGLWFALAFTSIGLETRFADLFRQENRKPLYAFLIAQGFNVIVTLIIAWILFS